MENSAFALNILGLTFNMRLVNSMELLQSYISVSKMKEVYLSLCYFMSSAIVMKLEEEKSAGVGLYSVYFSILFLNTVICHRLHATPSNGN